MLPYRGQGRVVRQSSPARPEAAGEVERAAELSAAYYLGLAIEALSSLEMALADAKGALAGGKSSAALLMHATDVERARRDATAAMVGAAKAVRSLPAGSTETSADQLESLAVGVAWMGASNAWDLKRHLAVDAAGLE